MTLLWKENVSKWPDSSRLARGPSGLRETSSLEARPLWSSLRMSPHWSELLKNRSLLAWGWHRPLACCSWLVSTKWCLMLASLLLHFNPRGRKILVSILRIHYLFLKKFCQLCDRQVFNRASPSLDDRVWEGDMVSFQNYPYQPWSLLHYIFHNLYYFV